jgi:MSHA biogenesis protein MshN
VAAACAAAAFAVAALLWFAWTHYQHSRAAGKQTAAVLQAAAKPAPAALKPAQGMSSTITVGPAGTAASSPPPVPALSQAQVQALPKPRAQEMARTAGEAGGAAAAGPASVPPFAAGPKSVAPFEPDSEEARAARQAIMAELQSRMVGGAGHETKHEAKIKTRSRERLAREAPAAGRASPAGSGALAARGRRTVEGRQESGSQRAEGEYRRALASLQDGRMTDTIAALEQVLALDPGHEAARQTLVGLLIEAKRSDDAIRQLQAGLALDARQPALAMLLARLQIERGGSGIETLMRTLPYAGTNPDYHAFLAGAQEREQRHREAAEQYQAALRLAPGNGVWWMGLGMSLQADKRNAEALEAFQRARASGMLSAELQAFVERRLQQLGR